MIKNYTSQAPINKSVQHIESKLVQHSAKNILKLYENQKLVGIAFIINVNGNDMPFKLPARIDRIEKKLREKVKRPRKNTIDRIVDQAQRTAWKLLSDWVDVQMSFVELDQAEFIEVFMPFIYDHSKDQTFFERMKKDKFKLLEAK
jgi:hypothetical protein